MNVKRKNGEIVNKSGWMLNTLLGKTVNAHIAFSKNSSVTHNITPYFSDETARKSVEAAYLEAERWKGEARKLRFNTP